MKIDRTVRVELTHEDIEQAIRNYVAAQVPGISDFKLDIFSGSDPAGVGDTRKPYCDLYAAAEIELAPQPVYRPLKAGDRNPLPLPPNPFVVDPAKPGSDFTRKFVVDPKDKARQVR